MSAYDRGQTVQISNVFTDAAGTPANPAAVMCVVRKPDGTVTEYTSASTPAINNTGSGAFTLIIVADQSGMWSHRWEGVTGTSVAVDEQQFHVGLSAFV